MSNYDEIQVSVWLRDGIAAARAGRRDEARELLMRVVEANEASEQGWLWLSGVVDTDEDRLICIENVLTLNPHNAQARAGLRHLQERGVGVDAQVGAGQAEMADATSALWRESESQRQVSGVGVVEPSGVAVSPPRTSQEPDLFLTPEGCAYCGRVVSDNEPRCPHCGGRLTTKQFKREDRSPVGYLLHAYWTLLACINVADYFLIGYVWNSLDQISSMVQDYLPFVVGPVVTRDASVGTFLEPDVWIQVARFTLLGLAVLGALDALGLFLRRPLAHTLGVALAALHLIIGLSLFVLGFLGYVMVAFRGLLTVMLTIFMFNTVEDFAKEERRERLEPDRHLVNDADYYTRGRAYEKLGMWAKALLHYRRAVARKPERDTYYAAMARAYARLGRYEQALMQVDQALRVSRTPEDWERLRAIIVEAQGRAAVTPDAGDQQPV
jgi:tetratricopeptide (TPR) repeat protein